MKLSERDPPRPERLATPTAAQLADGPRQLHVLGCVSCHGDMLQGDLFLDEAGIAKIYAPNLTLVAAKASDQQLAQAIRQGIGHDERPLLIMPSEGYQFMTDAEVAALIAAIRTIPKGGRETPAARFGYNGADRPRAWQVPYCTGARRDVSQVSDPGFRPAIRRRPAYRRDQLCGVPRPRSCRPGGQARRPSRRTWRSPVRTTSSSSRRSCARAWRQAARNWA